MKGLKSSIGTHLPLFEGLPGEVAPAGGLEECDVAPGLQIPLFLQLSQNTWPEEHLYTEHICEILSS